MRNRTTIAISFVVSLYFSCSLIAAELVRPPISNDTEVLRYSLKTLAHQVGNNGLAQKIQAMNAQELNACVAQLNPEQRHFINNLQRNAWGVLNNQWLAQQMLMQQNMFGGMPFLGNPFPWFNNRVVGYRPIIGWLPTGPQMNVGPVVVSHDRRYVRVPIQPFFSSIGPVHTFNYATGQYRQIWNPQQGYITPNNHSSGAGSTPQRTSPRWYLKNRTIR